MIVWYGALFGVLQPQNFWAAGNWRNRSWWAVDEDCGERYSQFR